MSADVKKAYDELVSKYKEYSTLGSVAGLLQWDMQSIMPPKGIERRSDQLALLAGLMHTKITSPQIGELLDKLNAAQNTLSDAERANVREMDRDYKMATKLPKELVEELSRHESHCHEVWVKARTAADFSMYAPDLEKMVSLTKQKAEFLGYKTTAYDALLDQFEPEATTELFTKLFDEVKAVSVPLLKKIMASKVKADKKIFDQDYSAEKQKAFGLEVMKKIGFDMEAGRLDTSVHPFMSGGANDVRITTRYNERMPQQALFGIIHETGHALYELGMQKLYWGTPLGEALSYGLHESQSRMWENFVGRNPHFWRYFFPVLQNHFPEQLKNTKSDELVLAINHVEPSLVRVEADEMTYDLHIILRFEIERDLFNGKISVSDLPKVWNQKVEEYLGLTPPDNGRNGVMQDVHWSGGSFGYFPSYSMGNLCAGQFWYKMRADMPNMDSEMEKGNYLEILKWLRENVHAHGRRYKRDELMKLATGKTLGTADYLRYLTEKYSALYQL